MASHALVNDLVVNRQERERLQEQLHRLEVARAELMTEAVQCGVPDAEIQWAVGCV